jgi:hypothetical protein
MDTGIEPKNDKITTSQPSTPLFRWIGEQLTVLAELFGESVTAARLKAYSANLVDLDLSQLEMAFLRASRDLKFFPKVGELRELAGAGLMQLEAKAHAAWDTVMDFCNRYVHSDIHGGYVVDQGCRLLPPPRLEQRILDCVRLCGGWRGFKTADDGDRPFLKKEFIEEYLRWEAVSRFDASQFCLPPIVQKFLGSGDDAKPAKPQPESTPATFGAKPMPQLLADAEINDRMEVLRQQAEIAQKLYEI